MSLLIDSGSELYRAVGAPWAFWCTSAEPHVPPHRLGCTHFPSPDRPGRRIGCVAIPHLHVPSHGERLYSPPGTGIAVLMGTQKPDGEG